MPLKVVICVFQATFRWSPASTHSLKLAGARVGSVRESGRLERFCRVTRVDQLEHLIASHIKPWRESDNRERLFEGSRLLVTPTIGHLFDRGFISFENGGELLISSVAHEDSLKKMGIVTDRIVNVGGFAEPQREFLEFHRTSVSLKRHLPRNYQVPVLRSRRKPSGS